MCCVLSAVEAAGRDVAAQGGRLQPGTCLLRVYQHSSCMMRLSEMCLMKVAGSNPCFEVPEVAFNVCCLFVFCLFFFNVSVIFTVAVQPFKSWIIGVPD